ncbi:MAG: aldo/keto reductase [Gammaproteobacteria bacterium]|nr:aldo/keto reductase [Gammaproteobacteria bacterium]
MDRRKFIGLGVSVAGAAVAGIAPVPAKDSAPLTRVVPASGERLPVIGMGSWITFNVGNDPSERAIRVKVLDRFFSNGGAMVDSSPMYGRSEEVIGYCLERLNNSDALFSATKVWMLGHQFGISQMNHSLKLWGTKGFDLMQIHNLVDWETHIETLQQWKAEGRIRYLGITTSHGRRHDDLLQIMRSRPIDFVQFTYNILDREAEARLLPEAADRGIAVIINRPFRRGYLFDYVRDKKLPAWAEEFDCRNWAQFFLKFIVSHPDVTCAIPATSQVAHMEENMGAGFGRLPDAATRARMAGYFASIT